MKLKLVHSFEDVISLDNLLSAWTEFIKGKRKRKDVQEFSFRLMDNIISLHCDLKSGAYRHEWLKEQIQLIQNFLSQKLKLNFHPDKIFIKTIYSGVDFLGWVHFPDHRVLRTTTKRRMLKHIETKNSKAETVQSYIGLINHGNSCKLREKILCTEGPPFSN